MAKHERKTVAQIEAEILRQAQGTATAKGERIVIERPTVSLVTEATGSGSHWFLAATAGEAGRSYVEAAAIRVARFWDVEAS